MTTITDWMRVPWRPSAHLLDGDRALCGVDMPAEALLPSGRAKRCGTCRKASTARVGRGAAPGTYLGPDPLVAVLQRYEREVCR